MQQSGDQQHFGLMRIDDVGEALSAAKLPAVPNRVVEDAQRVLKPRVRCAGVNLSGQAEL